MNYLTNKPPMRHIYIYWPEGLLVTMNGNPNYGFAYSSYYCYPEGNVLSLSGSNDPIVVTDCFLHLDSEGTVSLSGETEASWLPYQYFYTADTELSFSGDSDYNYSFSFNTLANANLSISGETEASWLPYQYFYTIDGGFILNGESNANIILTPASPTGGLTIGGCVYITHTYNLVTKFGINEFAYVKYKAELGKLERICIKKINVIDFYTYNYQDTFNRVWLEDELETIEEANAEIAAYNARRDAAYLLSLKNCNSKVN